MVVVLRARVVGPLEPLAEGFADELARQGYTVHTRRHQLGLVAHLSRWMTEQQVGVAELSPLVVERYVHVRRDGGYRCFRSAKALGPLLGYLRDLGVLAAAESRPAQTTNEVLLQYFGKYLLVERCLGARSARGYVDLVAGFVEQSVRVAIQRWSIGRWTCLGNDPRSMSSVVPRGPRCGLFPALPICWQIIAGQWA